MMSLFYSRSGFSAALLIQLLIGIPAVAAPRFDSSPLVANFGIGWTWSCSHALGYCEVQDNYPTRISLRRDFAPDARWIVSVLPSTAMALPGVTELRYQPDCACDKLVLVPGRSLKVLNRPDGFVVVDAEKATTLIRMLVDANGRKITFESQSRQTSRESVRTEGLTEALDWIDQQQGRTDGDRTAAAPPSSTAEIGTNTINDAARFTEPERTSGDLPEPVQRLHSRTLRTGCTARPDARQAPFLAQWSDAATAVFFVLCRRPDISPVYRVYTATAPDYRDARAVKVVQWTEATLKGGEPRANLDVPTIPHLRRQIPWSWTCVAIGSRTAASSIPTAGSAAVTAS